MFGLYAFAMICKNSAIGRVLAGLAAVALGAVPALAEEPAIPAVDAVVGSAMEEGHFPGTAVAVLRDGEPVHIGSYGVASIAHNAAVTPDTVFELASLTKQMTSLAVLDLANEGKLSLDDPLAYYIDDVPEAWSAVTIDQLLSHMAGLAHRFEEKPNDEFLLSYSREDMLASARKTPMIAQPGTDWNYSDQGYFLLGLVVERLSGKSFGDFLQERYFAPWQMKRTAMLDQSAIVPNLAQGYIFEDGKLRRGRRVWQFGLTSHFGVRSTLNDMIRWEASLSDPSPNLVSPIVQSWEIQRHFSNGNNCEKWGYARGWWAQHVGGRVFVSHGGYSGTAYIRDTTTGLSAIVLTNREVSEGKIEPMTIAWRTLNAVDPAIPSDGFRCWE